MTERWKKEKAYEVQRGAELLIELQAAIDHEDWEQFKTLYTRAIRYTKQDQREPLYRQFLVQYTRAIR